MSEDNNIVSPEEAERNAQRYEEIVEELSKHIVAIVDGKAYGPYFSVEDAEGDWGTCDTYRMSPPAEFVIALMQAEVEAGLL